MKSFPPTKISKIKNISQNKTKSISKRGKDRVWKGLERDFGVLVLVWGNFFATFFF
jgi:hypothetical protein